MSKLVKVTYNDETLETVITVDGQPFDTSIISGKEITDWAYPFMVRKVRWDGFYDEMVAALGGEKAFDLLFEGSDEALEELKEAWEDAPVNVVSGEQGNTVTIMYDADALTTEITVNDQPFDTSRINGKEIEDWVYPFMMRKVKWDGIFDELKAFLGTDEYDILFSGSRAAMKALMEECPEMVSITLKKIDSSDICNAVCSSKEIFSEFYADRDNGKMTEHIISEIKKAVEVLKKSNETVFPVSVRAITDVSGVSGSDSPRTAFSIEELIECISEIYESWDYPRANIYRRDNNIRWDSGFTIEISAQDENASIDMTYELEEQAYYLYNKGCHEKDLKKAFEYYKKAAEKGNVWSQKKLGDCYYNGEGVTQDYAKSVKWYTKAAEQDNADAQESLAQCYTNGNGVEQDYSKALEWRIPTIIDRLVQQSILQVLEPICEAKFHERNNGFRPNRSAEHALAQCYKMIQQQNLHFVVDIDIKGFFDNVNHAKLIRQMWAMGIRDKKLICVIKQMLKAPIIMTDGLKVYPTKGTPQGGILSPLLANIVLNELDWWISSQWETFPTRKNYAHIIKDGTNNNGHKYVALRKTGMKEMYLVRYADDFKIFCRKRSDADKIFTAVKKWLKERLKLDISEEKSKVVNLKKHYSEFLGFKLKAVPKRGKFTVMSHMSDKAAKKETEKLKNQIKVIGKCGNSKEQLQEINQYNSIIFGIHHYYRYATAISSDCAAI